MLQSTVLPDLQMLPVNLLVPHEECDPRRVERLSHRILEEGILKNPPIVSEIPGDDRYVVLDGANRVQAFAFVGIPHIVAQVVDYESERVTLDTWHHVVSGMNTATLKKRLMEIEGVQLQACSLDDARQALARDEIVAYIVQADGVIKLLSTENRPLPDLILLRNLVSAYKGFADIIRASNDVWEKQAPCYPEINALIIFPALRPKDILWAAQNGEKVPSGITRHIISERALNINIPIGILMTDWELERKKQWLQDWIKGRLVANAIRFYAESTFSFNE